MYIHVTALLGALVVSRKSSPDGSHRLKDFGNLLSRAKVSQAGGLDLAHRGVLLKF